MAYLGTTPANQVIDSTLIADGTVTTSDIADGAITTAKIAAGAVITADLASGLTINFADGSASTPSITNDGDTNTGIFFPAADTIAFAEGGAEVARFDSSGNLGVGVTSPTQKLDVSGLIQSQNNAGSNDSVVGAYNFYNTNASASANPNRASIVAGRENSAWGAYLQFNTSTGTSAVAERMRIDSSGNLLVGTTGISTGTFKGVQNAVNSGGFGNYLSQNPAGTSTRQWIFGMNSSNEYVVYGYNNTTFNSGAYIAWGGTSWTAQSDERSKDIIEPITDAANKVSTLRAVIGKYKTDEEGTRRSFLIAQDVQAVLPEAVDASKPDSLGVQYTEVIPLLVAAIKEQQAIITELKARVEALENV